MLDFDRKSTKARVSTPPNAAAARGQNQVSTKLCKADPAMAKYCSTNFKLDATQRDFYHNRTSQNDALYNNDT